MSVENRNGGKRRAPRGAPGASLLGPSLGIHTNDPGERRLNTKLMWSIENLYHMHPAVAAARTVLQGQLLGGGIQLKRNGEDVNLKPAFKQHLEEMWMPFAKDVIDSFLKFGLCLVSYEEDTHSVLTQRKKRKTGPGVPNEPSGESPNYIPVVPQMGTFEIAYVMGGRNGYKRDYFCYGTAPGKATTIDDEMRLVVRQHPDAGGNVNSPMASVFDLGSFVAALTELAMTAEITNARPRIFTQMREAKANSGLDPQALFYDTESRQVQSSADGDESAAQAQSLAMQQALCRWINQLQTRQAGNEAGGVDHNLSSFSGGGGAAAGKSTHVPPEVPPSLFTLPKGQEIITNGVSPQARGDLEQMLRLATEQFGAALGVPADLIFQGKFASKTTSQMSLLNTTVTQLAKSVNQILTMAYRDIYQEDSSTDDMTLELLTAPLAATEEVIQLYAAGLAPLEIAMPAVLHAIGATKDQIEKAVASAIKEKDEEKACQCENKDYEREERKLNLQERKTAIRVGGEARKAEAESQAVDLEQRRANVAKTKKETAVLAKKPAGAAGGGSSSG